MKGLIIAAIAALLVVSAAASRRKSEFKPLAVNPQVILNPLPQDYIEDAALPDNWDWRVRVSVELAPRKAPLTFGFSLERLWRQLLLLEPQPAHPSDTFISFLSFLFSPRVRAQSPSSLSFAAPDNFADSN